MSSFSRFLKYFVIFCGSCVILLSLLSLIYDLRFWYFKVLDFPRLQYFILASTLLVLFLFLNKKWKFPAILFGVGLLAAILIQGTMIWPYYFGKKTVLDASVQKEERKNTLSILIANVLISNKNTNKFINLVQTHQPDMVLAMEVNSWWVDELQVLKQDYPYSMEYPLDNAYGLALYSKLPMKDQKTAFLNKNDVPSFHAQILLESGKSFMFHGVHPVAPVPSGKYPDNVGEKEVALVKVGKMVEKEELPAIVAGDFNDVSWSHTSRLFQNSGNLRNVRIGRGLYNTFNAHSPVFRWPLDHFFVSKEFSLVRLERLPKFGSDHFPLLAEFTLED